MSLLKEQTWTAKTGKPTQLGHRKYRVGQWPRALHGHYQHDSGASLCGRRAAQAGHHHLRRKETQRDHQCVRIPAEATHIRYSIRGGAGGAGPKDSWGERGGSGAEVQGQVHRPGVGTAAAQEFTIWGAAGGYGPMAAWNDNAVEFAIGYGNGGPSMGVPYHTSTVSTEQWSERWCHGGGAGSAIAIGGDPEGPGQLVAVAGGGGAAGTGTYSREAANMGPNVWPVREGGNGGKSWDGADGGQSHYETKYAQVTAAGGSGARGGQGGNGGSTANTSYVPKDLEFDKIIAGQAGGNHGSGNHGGGNGGAPVKFERRRSVRGDGHIDDYIALSSAAGGGGYAGGGSGTLVVISRDPILKWAASDVPGQLGAIGAGGAGSSYLAPSLDGGFSATGEIDFPDTGGVRTNGTVHMAPSLPKNYGEPGNVTISFWVPEDMSSKPRDYTDKC